MKRWEYRARGKHQRGRKLADCADCDQPIWSADKSKITSAVPLVLVHERCWKLRQTDQ